jgi:hypothetical protein
MIVTDRADAIEVLAGFRERFCRCMTRRADALFELAGALLCADGPVKTLVGLSLVPEHRRGHGAMYDALNCGRLDVQALRRDVAGLPLPRAVDGRLMLAVDVSPWLRPDADTSPDRSFCPTCGRGKDEHRMIPGWPYSFSAALEPGRTCWTAGCCGICRWRSWAGCARTGSCAEPSRRGCTTRRAVGQAWHRVRLR